MHLQPEEALAAMMPSTPMPPTPAPPTPMMPSTPLMPHMQPQTPLSMMPEENGHVSMPPPSLPTSLGYPGTPAALGYAGGQAGPLQHIDDMPHLPADQVRVFSIVWFVPFSRYENCSDINQKLDFPMNLMLLACCKVSVYFFSSSLY